MSFRPRFITALAAGLAAFGFGFAGANPDMLKATNVPSGVSTVRRTSRRQRMQLTSGGGHPLPIKKQASISRPPKHTSRAKARKRTRCKVKRRSHR